MSNKELRYALLGLPANEAMELKILVRELESKFNCNWIYEAAGHAFHWASARNANADLWIVGTEVWNTWQAANTLPDNLERVLVAVAQGEMPSAGALHFMRLPVDAHSVEKVMSEVTSRLLGKTADKGIFGHAPSNTVFLTGASWIDEPVRRFKTAQHFEVGHAQAPQILRSKATAANAQQYKLVRWPSANALRSSGDLRIATALTGRFVDLDELEMISRQSQERCLNFIEQMRKADLLLVNRAPEQQARKSEKSEKNSRASGLLGLIRKRLGL